MPRAEKRTGKFTYSDYLSWPTEERWELLDGEAYAMTPAPSLGHQRVVVRLVHFLEGALRGHPCIPFVAPVDVILSEDTVVQPDVVVVCDRRKLHSKAIHGAPDLVVEVLSPGTSLKDRKAKRELYERHGVREYLLVDPEGRYAERYLPRTEGGYGKADVFGPTEPVALQSLGSLELRLDEIFEPAEAPERTDPSL